MKKTLLLSLLAVLLFGQSYSQESLWKITSAAKLAPLPKTERRSEPLQSKLYSLDFDALKTQLQLAPSRDANQVSTVIIAFPSHDGTMHHYRIYEASVMHPDLAARYPEINSYAG